MMGEPMQALDRVAKVVLEQPAHAPQQGTG